MESSQQFYKRQVEVFAYIFIDTLKKRLEKFDKVSDSLTFEQKLYNLICFGIDNKYISTLNEAIRHIRLRKPNAIEKFITLQYMEMGFQSIESKMISTNYYRKCVNAGLIIPEKNGTRAGKNIREKRYLNITQNMMDKVQIAGISNLDAMLILRWIRVIVLAFETKSPYSLKDVDAFTLKLKGPINEWKDKLNE